MLIRAGATVALCMFASPSATAVALLPASTQGSETGATIRTLRPRVGTSDPSPQRFDQAADVVNLHDDSLLSALGDRGLARIAGFKSLPDGWDGVGSFGLNSASVDAARAFFSRTRLVRDGMGAFMSRDGRLIVNWLESGQLGEIEFAADHISFYSERTGSEGEVEASYAGDRELLAKI